MLTLDRDGRIVRDSSPIEGLNPGGGNFGPDGRYYVGLRGARTIMAVVSALRNGTEIPDRKLEALHRFATLVRNRGWISDADVDAFLAAGYARRNVLEVILGVATKVMSNYTNHIAHTRLDPFMRGNEWTKPAVKPAA